MKKNIFITGSSRGIGKAIAQRAYAENYQVIIHGKTLSAELANLEKELPGSLCAPFDLADIEATRNTFHYIIEKVGPIDVLVNNAAVNLSRPILDVDDDTAITEYRINVLGAIHCIQAVIPGMLAKKEGWIINISSIKGLPELATMGSFTYSQTKAALISMTMSLAKYLGAHNIYVNAIAPGYSETDLIRERMGAAEMENIKSKILLNRMAQPEEIADVVLFLARTTYLLGSVITADGGYRISQK